MYIGIDIGGTKCAVVLGDKEGSVVSKHRFETADLNSTLEKIKHFASDLAKNADVEAAGVSCGGPLDERRGIIMSPPNLPGWDDVHIKEIIETTLGVPCGVRNDANACAMAEYLFGAGKGTENMVFMTFGTGLGAGVIVNGRLMSGANGNAGELGHIRLSPYGPVGYGKQGSFEGFCSGGGIRQLGKAVAQSCLQRGITPAYSLDADAAEIANAARKGDKAALEVFEISGTKLGEGLSIIIDILNPEKIIIGSIFARCRDLLEAPMYRVLEKETLASSLSVCDITVPNLGEGIGDAAALAVAMEVHNELRK